MLITLSHHDRRPVHESVRTGDDCDRCIQFRTPLQVEAKVQAAIKEEDVTKRIEERLVQERARLEAELEAKIKDERRAQVLRKRREQEQRLKEQVGLDRNVFLANASLGQS